MLIKGNTSRIGSAIQILPSDMENTLYCYRKMSFFIHCKFFCQKYKFTYLITYFRQLCLSSQCLKSTKEFANLWFVLIWEVKRQFCRYKRSGNFKVFNSLYTWLIESCFFSNNIFSRLCFEVSVFCFGWLYLISPKVESHTTGGNRKENGRYVIFRILRDALLLSLLRMLVAWFIVVATWFICFGHSKWSSKMTIFSHPA